MKATLTYLLAFVAICLFASWALVDVAGLPTVEESYLNQECVRVLLADGSEGDCDDLPEKYHHVWVQ